MLGQKSGSSFCCKVVVLLVIVLDIFASFVRMFCDVMIYVF